ncbi:Lipoprotein-releasing system ATP-binding protein LolD [Maioricimonas rarisocia]|uniref:Lipoprotein-releasing system ATP-binding protein LolD n=1 Tax=Maioricimonas rarisocia TaxID=2528026 RepID=A0A517ZA89_9PLAN|nr:ABC transporter ATP-binding protein [Maioricimonas rarisocia]QDU39350.1 Lipoprotein-releasing system ATP-binding protein LolD [Maioricimonas rarisocia]
MIRLDNVTKDYSRRGETITALRSEALEFASGDYVAIVGPSGSGKTTLLSLLGGMLSPTTGKVWLEDTSVYDLTAAERSALRSERMGFVFQTFNLVPYLTALQNVQIPLCLLGLSAAEQEPRATELLARFGLADRLHHRPAELSVGQQQRVALARTLVNDPQIVLADEPTGNLDPESRETVLDAFDAAHREGRTIVMVTHDPVAAGRASRVLTLKAGELADSESPIPVDPLPTRRSA